MIITISTEDSSNHNSVDPICPHAVAILCPFSQFCEIGISLLSLQKQPSTAQNLFQRGVEYGKYAKVGQAPWGGRVVDPLFKVLQI